MKLLFLSLTATAALFSSSCKKESDDGHCTALQAGIVQADEAKVKGVFLEFLYELDDRTYSEKNLRRLVGRISSACSIEAELKCYDCIETGIPQSEVQISGSSGGITTKRVIDISQDKKGEIIFAGMHD